MATKTPNILIILTDQLRHPTVYETDELRRFRREALPAEASLRDSGVSFDRHYVMSAACAPSRASILTGQYPSLHGVTQTDGLAKSADGPEMFWLAPDTVPTIGDWFRAGGYRTFYKGKWHVSHSHLEGADGKGYLQTLDKDGNVERGERRRLPRKRTCSTTTASRSGSARKRTGWATRTPARREIPSRRTKRSLF